MNRTLMTEALKKLIGASIEPTVFNVEEGAIRRYAEVIGDPNPLYHDVEYAKTTEYGTLICPPGFTGLPEKGGMQALPRCRMLNVMSDAGAPVRGLDGGIEYEFFAPIKAGDVITATSRFTDIYEKESKVGTILLGVLETTFTNQKGDIVLISWTTGIKY